MHAALKQTTDFNSNATTLLTLVPGVLNIGRTADNDIQIDEPDISPHHARIVTYFQEAYLVDLGSEAGVWLNGERVIKHSIRPGDVISLGEHHIVISAPADWFN